MRKKKEETTPPKKSQEELWVEHCKEYMTFMKVNMKRPSKHYLQDRRMFNWFKHNKKVYLSGRMPANRVSMFRALLDDAENYRKINQYAHVHEEIVNSKP